MREAWRDVLPLEEDIPLIPPSKLCPYVLVSESFDRRTKNGWNLVCWHVQRQGLQKKAQNIKKNDIYTIYIIYILYICIKDGKMESTVTYKKKIIDLKEDTFKSLSVMAARQGTNLKKLIENLLDKTAEEYDDSEAYRYMTENYPDGKVKLDKNERKEFMDWLGVVEK